MQTSSIGRVFAAFLMAGLASCTRTSDNPYEAIQNAPLVQATLHTVTLVTDGSALAEELHAKGFTPIQFASNSAGSDSVESSLWSVPVPVVGSAAHFKSPDASLANVRVLRMALAAGTRSAESEVNEDFFANVLGAEVPRWPVGIQPSDKVRVQVWTFLIPDVGLANKRLRDSGIPVVYDPVRITTAYLGDHKTMAIRAPDGTIVELVELTALTSG